MGTTLEMELYLSKNITFFHNIFRNLGIKEHKVYWGFHEKGTSATCVHWG